MPLLSQTGKLFLGTALVFLLTVSVCLAETPDTERMSWLLQRDGLENMALTGQKFEQGEIGGGGSSLEVADLETPRKKSKSGWPVLYSLILPGAGEASMGYTRGYFMMLADAFAWWRVATYHGEGGDLKDKYIAFANEHYSDEDLLEGYRDGGFDPERSGQGAIYFSAITSEHNFNTLADLDNLPLYVTKEEDFREYYENLGKWDQFIFGWDDYTRASIEYADIGYVPTLTRADLQHPWVSRNREKYRLMRNESNDAYKTRDRWLYVNIGLRVFSVLQTAYLGGLLGGGPAEELEVAGHAVRFIAQPAGWTKGAVAATVSF